MNYLHSDIKHFISATDFDSTNAFITGVTGFLGGHFVFWQLQLPGKLYLLVRAESVEVGWQRILDSLNLAAKCYDAELPNEKELRKRIVCVLGDMSQPQCGISTSDIQYLKDSEIGTVWHCAADMGFLARHRDRLLNTNVKGTETLMEIAISLSVQRFVYISTAYTAGKRNGEIAEVLHDDSQGFGNCYEESKFMAEIAVAQYCKENSLAWNILRPTMVMGPLSNCESGGTRFGGYGFIKNLYEMRDIFSKLNQKIRLVMPASATFNSISVDQVVYDMVYLRATGFGKQNIYHLGSSTTMLARDVMVCQQKAAGVDALELVEQRDSDPTSLEIVFDKGTRFARCYFHSDKRFIRSLPIHSNEFSIPTMDICMENFIEELKEEERISKRLEFDHEQVTSWDGQVLNAYSKGDVEKPTVVFINAYGMPLEFSLPISKVISKKYRFVSWDSRWVPDTSQDFDVEKCSSLTHVKDLMAILDDLQIKQCALVGWSSGAQVCLRALSEYPDRFICGALLNSGVSLVGDDICQTEYQQSLRSLFPKVAGDRKAAKLYCDLIYGDTTKVGLRDQGSIGTMLNSLDPELMKMTSAPFRDPESLYRYANMLFRNFEEDKAAFTDKVRTPVLVYGSEEDEVTHADLATALSERLINSELVLAKTATHFAQYTDIEVGDMVVDYISRQISLSASVAA